MQNDQLNLLLLNAIRKKLPKGTNMANYLSDLLCIGREAVYRRFRGEVPFSMSETFTISKKLDISLDNLAGITLSEDTKFDLNLYRMDNEQDVYRYTLEYYETLFTGFLEEGAAELWDLTNRMPLGVTMHYPHLAKFHLFKRLYQKKLADTGATQPSIRRTGGGPGGCRNAESSRECIFTFSSKCYHVGRNVVCVTD